MREKGGKENLYFLLVWPGLTQPFTAHCLVSAAQHSQGGASICLVPGNNFKAHFSLGHPESGPRTKEEKKKKTKKTARPDKGPVEDRETCFSDQYLASETYSFHLWGRGQSTSPGGWGRGGCRRDRHARGGHVPAPGPQAAGPPPQPDPPYGLGL